MDSQKSPCLFSFGVIADVQYADLDNRLNFSKTCTRHYRNAMVLLQEAIEYWSSSDIGVNRPSFYIQLGDLIDGYNNEGGKKQSFKILQRVLNEFDTLGYPVHHTFGNHEFYNFTRVELMNSKLFSGGDCETTERDSKCGCFSITSTTNDAKRNPAAYYHFSPADGFRFVNLDTYDMSTIGHATLCPAHQESLRLLRSVNKNECLDSPIGLEGPDMRFVQFNGGVGERQMEWLEEVLREAGHAREKVIIFGHVPMSPLVSGYLCMLWNYQEMLDLIHSFACVLGVISGHAHSFAQSVDESGIWFVTLPGVVEIPPGKNGFGTVEVFADKLVLNGVGEVKSCEINFP